MVSTNFHSATLGPVASSRRRALHVLKVGSASQHHPQVFDDLADIVARGVRVLLVAGGAAGIAEHYQAIGRPQQILHLRDGREVRHVPADEVAFLTDSYRRVTLPRISAALQERGVRSYATPAGQDRLVVGDPNPPLRAVIDGRARIVRDHRAGTVSAVDTAALADLLETFPVVVLSPPIAATDDGPWLNVDADVLAAELANRMDADHLRLVTGTPGLLRDPQDPSSTITDLAPGEGYRYAAGRMRQKVRAAELALTGSADVAIVGPHRLTPATRVWRSAAPHPQAHLLTQAVEISSVSGDEHELASFLRDWARHRGLDADLDDRGNLVVTKGEGQHHLLLLGHLDTVPHRWPARWEEATLHGRGAVDAKGSLTAFLEVLSQLPVPADCRVTVAGAVEEETTSEGAFHLAKNLRADAVVIGEPSGSRSLTIAYYGLVKIRMTLSIPAGHTAGQGVKTAADLIGEALSRTHQAVHDLSPESMCATLGVLAQNRFDVQHAEAVLDIRVAPETSPEQVIQAVEAAAESVTVTVLRATPAKVTARTSPLVRAFSRAFRHHGIAPRFLAKKGSSDMNTLADCWPSSIPMVAYGPGEAALDHAPNEHLPLEEYLVSTEVLNQAIRCWFDARSSDVTVHHLASVS